MAMTRRLAKWFSNYGNQRSPGSKLRAKRILPLLRMIESTYQRNGAVSILDIGGTLTYWTIVPTQFLADHNVNITIINLPGAQPPAADRDFFSFTTGDACNLAQFGDKTFDIAHSNSVVEHVGDWARMARYAEELRRVAKSYFCQTPNFWFPVEPHCMTPFFHWLPVPTRLWLVRRFQLGNWRKADSVDDAARIVESARLLNKAMLKALFPDATIVTETYLFLPKSFIAIRA